jgi:hypothetical protein
MPEENTASFGSALSELAVFAVYRFLHRAVQEVGELTVRTVAPASTCGIDPAVGRSGGDRRHRSAAPPQRGDLADHLRIALSSRSAIDQAIGIIMAQQRGTPEQAFAALRTISQRRNIKLRIVAAELVETVGRA